MFGLNEDLIEKNKRLRQANKKIRKEHAELKKEIIEFLEQAPLQSGVCCCGDEMKNHSNPMNCGHSPVDSGEYAIAGFVKRLSQPQNSRLS